MGRTSLRAVLGLVNRETMKEPAQAFLDDLIYVIQKPNYDPNWRQSPWYKPSSMGCTREMYYIRTQEAPNPSTEPNSYELIGMAESGSARHDSIQHWIAAMKDAGIDCEYVDVETYVKQRNLPIKIIEKKGMETKCFDPRYNMSFLTDGIVRYRGRYFIFEFKTETSMKWNRRTMIEDKHVYQGCAYALSFGISQVIFVYENRDTCAKKAYLLEATPELIRQRVVNPMEVCEKSIRRKVVPCRPDRCPDNYCPYSNACMRDGK